MGQSVPTTFQLVHAVCRTMVGKKDMCPVCLEKVDLKSLYAGRWMGRDEFREVNPLWMHPHAPLCLPLERPWETRNLTWIQMLDGIRYLVVWNPLIFMCVSLLFHLFAPALPHAGQHLPPGLHHGLGHDGPPPPPLPLPIQRR